MLHPLPGISSLFLIRPSRSIHFSFFPFFFFFFLLFFFFFFKVPSVENPELTNVLPLRPGWSRSDYSHACFTPTARNVFLVLISTFAVRSLLAFVVFQVFSFLFVFFFFFLSFFSFLLQIRLPVFELC